MGNHIRDEGNNLLESNASLTEFNKYINTYQFEYIYVAHKVLYDRISDLDNSDSVITTINTTINILRPYLHEGLPNLHPFLRPSLWSRAICSRTVLDLEGSSLADSFVTWDNSFQMSEIIIATMETVEVGGGGGEGEDGKEYS